jgi:hypothetical protein
MKRAEEVPGALEGPAYRPPYLAALIATAMVWALYALTLAPTTAFWDTSEYIATAHILGIPHPPGNPLFVVLARAWEVMLAPLGLPVAVRINLFSATMGALAHGCWFLLAHRILSDFSTNKTFRLIGASAAVLVSASAFTVWAQSNVNEKVYTVTLFTIALLSWLAFRWRDRLGEGKDDNLILLMVFILALSVGNHLMAFLAAPALIVFILWVEPRTLINWKLYAAALVAIVLGLSIHLYLPLRAGLDPIINEADPTCLSVGEALKSIVTMGRTGCAALSESLSRTQYQKPPMTINPVFYPMQMVPRDINLFGAQIANYLQYFDWQWARGVNGFSGFFGPIRTLITMLFVALGVNGAISHYRRDRKSFAYVAVLFLTLSLGLVFYLNFKYGYQYPDHGLDEKEVRERDYFFIVSFSIWGIWTGIGIAALWKWVGERYLRLTRPDEGLPPLAAAPVLALALIPLVFNWGWANRRHDYAARDWAYNLLNSVEPYGVLFTNGDNDTFPLWYAQEVEGIRKDVTVIVMSYLNTNWYVKQLRDLTAPCTGGKDPNADPTRIICQRPFDKSKGPKIYADLLVDPASAEPGRRTPSKTILPLDDRQIDAIAGQYLQATQQAQTFSVGNIQTIVPAGTQLAPADQFMAQIINAAIADRPVYYATTTNAFQTLNLSRFLIRQGMAFKLINGSVQPDSTRGILAFPNTELRSWAGEFVDLPRSELLVNDVFIHRSNLPNWDHWVDVATVNIPFYYWAVHAALAQLYQSIGNAPLAQKHVQAATGWQKLARELN